MSGIARLDGLPSNVSSALSAFLAAARDALSGDLVSAVLFGSAAEGRLGPSSDTNLLLVLRRFTPEKIDQLRFRSPDGSKRHLVDDHLHDVPEPVYELLRELAARAPNPLTVILERDGAYPPMPALLQELQRTRDALAAGRRLQQG